MSEAHITNIDDGLWKRFNRRLDNLRSDGCQKKGDKRKYLIEAIRLWLDHGAGEWAQK